MELGDATENVIPVNLSQNDSETIEGYDHIHRDIAALLTTKTRQNEFNHYGVDHCTLALQMASPKQKGTEFFSADTLPMDLLAGVAIECDRAIFANKNHDIPKKILGLILLSQFPMLPCENDKDSFVDYNSKEQMMGQNPAILVASMAALNLLESSIRAIVVRYRCKNSAFNTENHNAERNNLNLNSKSTRGAPLLRDMIQEISCMNHITLDQTSSRLLHPRVIAASDLTPILRSLLLPTKLGGINLRNLISHGFLSTIDRHWFSLTLVLIQTLDLLLVSNLNLNDHEKATNDNEMGRAKGGIDQELSTISLTQYAAMASEVHHGKSILSQNETSFSRLKRLELQTTCLVPPSHLPLLRFSLYLLAPSLRQSIRITIQKEKSMAEPATLHQEQDAPIPAQAIPSLTAIFATVMCSLLEHSLRLLWCSTNNRPDKCIARPSQYYVTLDGHGQRDKHEVMLTPYLSDGRTKNQLIPAIGAQSCAMLSDLFAAPSVEAPNIRSALCHGRWDGELVKELEGLAESTEKSVDWPEKSNSLLVDAACALLSCLDLISSNISGETRICNYRPVYTYTSSAVRNLNEALEHLIELDELISNESVGKCIKTMQHQHSKLCDDLRHFEIGLDVIEEMACDLFPTMKTASYALWNIDDTYSENKTNTALAGNIAALALLSDTSDAVKNYLSGVRQRICILPMQPKSTKDRRALKTATRFCSAAIIARDFYKWTVYVALVAMKGGTQNESRYIVDFLATKDLSREDIVRASVRSKRTISTFDCFLSINLDRSLKALQQYLRVMKKSWT